MRSDTEAFILILYLCAIDQSTGQKEDGRHTRFADIINLRWEFGMERMTPFIYKYNNEITGDPKEVITKYSRIIPKSAYLKLFTLCMDVLSAGKPITKAEASIIYFLQNSLQISQQDFEATMLFCRNRESALNIEWERIKAGA